MFGHFGFSYVGLIFMIMLMVPNIIWAKNQPKGYTAEKENKVLAVFVECHLQGQHYRYWRSYCWEYTER